MRSLSFSFWELGKAIKCLRLVLFSLFALSWKCAFSSEKDKTFFFPEKISSRGSSSGSREGCETESRSQGASTPRFPRPPADWERGPAVPEGRGPKRESDRVTGRERGVLGGGGRRTHFPRPPRLQWERGQGTVIDLSAPRLSVSDRGSKGGGVARAG